MEDTLDVVWGDLSASAQSVIDKQGVAYTDNDGDLVTSIVGGKDCVFTCYRDLDLQDGKPVVPHCCLLRLRLCFIARKDKVAQAHLMRTLPYPRKRHSATDS